MLEQKWEKSVDIIIFVYIISIYYELMYLLVSIVAHR